MTRAIADGRAVRVLDRARVAALGSIEAVVIVGPTCVGKTTLVDAVRDSELCASGVVDVPTRFITRTPRGGDNLVENVHVTVEDFGSRVGAGEIELCWIRRMEGGRAVRYGFARPRSGAIAVFSANNAILAFDAELSPVGALDHALVIGVHAPPEVRAQRLQQRSPDLLAHPEEVAHRLAEPASCDVHVVIDNFGELESVTRAEIVTLLRSLVR
jgi:ribose 1,5-bisphosphokinase PhnN